MVNELCLSYTSDGIGHQSHARHGIEWTPTRDQTSMSDNAVYAKFATGLGNLASGRITVITATDSDGLPCRHASQELHYFVSNSSGKDAARALDVQMVEHGIIWSVQPSNVQERSKWALARKYLLPGMISVKETVCTTCLSHWPALAAGALASLGDGTNLPFFVQCTEILMLCRALEYLETNIMKILGGDRRLCGVLLDFDSDLDVCDNCTAVLVTAAFARLGIRPGCLVRITATCQRSMDYSSLFKHATPRQPFKCWRTSRLCCSGVCLS